VKVKLSEEVEQEDKDEENNPKLALLDLVPNSDLEVDRYEVIRGDGGRDIYGIKRKKIMFGDEYVTVIIFNDLTTVIRMEHQKAEKKSIDLLIASISHELNTPLNGILTS
jgi:signal transduction histidine kinase